MKESLRRAILFTAIVITGSVMILFDVPLILMIPLILAVGFVILLLLGAITPAEIRSVFSRPVVRKPGKTGIIQRLKGMKFFNKTPVQPDNRRPALPKKEEQKKTGAADHVRSFISSVRSLGTVLKQRSKHEKKVEHINELLDKAVSEKVKSSALASAADGSVPKIPVPGGGGGPKTEQPAKDQDPFLSLSDDEFDIGLLDGVDDPDTSRPAVAMNQKPASQVTVSGADMPVTDPGIPMPSLDINPSAETILKDNPESLEEFRGLEGGESIDRDFGDLDSLNTDDIDLDIDIEDETPNTPGTSAAKTQTTGPSSAPGPAGSIKTDWIPSDAPKNADTAENLASMKDDMASFAGGAAGSDEDLLSSLAADVKHVAKEQNTSLLRDLKDFKAPAKEIENELNDIFTTMKAVPEFRNTVVSPAKKIR